MTGPVRCHLDNTGPGSHFSLLNEVLQPNALPTINNTCQQNGQTKFNGGLQELSRADIDVHSLQCNAMSKV